MCVECVYLCVIVSICVVFCVNMCQYVSFCVILCRFVCIPVCIVCICTYFRVPNCGVCISTPEIDVPYRVPNELFIKVSVLGCTILGGVYMCVFGGVSIWGVSVSICVNCVYSCVYCVYLYVFWCEILWIPVEMCEILCFVSVFVNSMEWRRTTQIEAVGFSIWMFFLFFEFLMNFLWMYVFFWIFLYFDWFSLIFFWFFYGFHWFFWFELILNGFWGSENGEKTGFLEWLWKCLKMSKKWVFGT